MGAEVVTISGAGGALAGVRLLAAAFEKTNPRNHVDVLPIIGTQGSLRAVLAGKLDIGATGRPLTEEERKTGVVEIPFVRTPFVFGVHHDVKESDISLPEVIDIYGGRKTTWKDGSPIRLIMRHESESDLDILRGISKELAVAVNSALRREGMIFAVNDKECLDLIESIPGSFGATTQTMLTQEKREVRVLSLDGVAPGAKALADGAYPYSKQYALVTMKTPSAPAQRFIGFVRSREGRSVLSRAGFVPGW